MATLIRKKGVFGLAAGLTTVVLLVMVGIYHQLYLKGASTENELSEELWTGGDPYFAFLLASKVASSHPLQQGRLGILRRNMA